MDMPSWVTPLATLGLFCIAGVKIFWECRAAKRRRRAAKSQISDTAFLLSLQLKSWLSLLEQKPLHPDRRDVADQRLAETRIEELGRLAPEVRGHISKRIETAFVAFQEATKNLKKYYAIGAIGQPPLREYVPWDQLKTNAEKSLCECVKALEDGPISKDTLDDHRNLQERLERESLTNQLWEEVTGEPTNEEEVAESQPPEGSE